MKIDQSRQVARRMVFYVPGYDPMPARRYRELYRKESAAQARISGYDIKVQARTQKENPGWTVISEIDGQPVETSVEVLGWSDLVQKSMSGSILTTYIHLIRTAFTYISTGTLWRLMQLRQGPVIAALYPVGMLLFQLGIALLLGWAVGESLSWGATEIERLIRPFPGQGFFYGGVWILSVLLGVVTAWLVLRWFKSQDGRLFAYYLMHDYAFSARDNGAYPDVLEQRIAVMSDRIGRALQSDVDEVLVVGHSSGAHVAVSVLSDLLRENDQRRGKPVLGLLTLGQVVPMQSFLPEAGRLRRDLQFLSAQHDIAWVDISAPGDGCSFALCDPVAVSGVANSNKLWPLVQSAAFTQTLSDARWSELRWKFFRLHFQYLCAFDRPGKYDYFQITAGPKTLAERYLNQPGSPSRIERAVSKYRSVSER